MDSYPFKQLANFFDLISLCFFAGVRTMCTPLFTSNDDFYARAFALENVRSHCFEQCFNVGKHY